MGAKGMSSSMVFYCKRSQAPQLYTIAIARIVGYSKQSRLHKPAALVIAYRFGVYHIDDLLTLCLVTKIVHAFPDLYIEHHQLLVYSFKLSCVNIFSLGR